MTKRITTNQTTGISLTYPDGAVWVYPGVTVSNSNPNGVGISVDDTVQANVRNQGTITQGISVGSGVVTNLGTISGDVSFFSAKPKLFATLVNRGVVQDGSFGADIQGQSVVANIENSGLFSVRDTRSGTYGVPRGILTLADNVQMTINNRGTFAGYTGIWVLGTLSHVGSHTKPSSNIDLAVTNSGVFNFGSDPIWLWGKTVNLDLTNTNTGYMHNASSIDPAGITATADQTLTAELTNRGNLQESVSLTSSGTLSVSVNNSGAIGNIMLSGMLGHAEVTNTGQMSGFQITGISATLENRGTIAGNVQVDANASLSASGTLGNVVDNGTITIGHDKLTLGSASGSGMLFITPNTKLDVAGNSAGPSINFMAGSNETLTLEKGASLSSAIIGFGNGDLIDLVGVRETSANFAAGVLTVNSTAGSVALNVDGNYTQKNFVFASDHHGARTSRGIADHLL